MQPTRLKDHRNVALQQLGLTNKASISPIEEQIQVKFQLMIDGNFDKQNKMKVVRLGPEEWISWNFYKVVGHNCCCCPWPYLPRFYHVFRLTVKRIDRQLFLWFDCVHMDGFVLFF